MKMTHGVGLSFDPALSLKRNHLILLCILTLHHFTTYWTISVLSLKLAVVTPCRGQQNLHKSVETPQGRPCADPEKLLHNTVWWNHLMGDRLMEAGLHCFNSGMLFKRTELTPAGFSAWGTLDEAYYQFSFHGGIHNNSRWKKIRQWGKFKMRFSINIVKKNKYTLQSPWLTTKLSFISHKGVFECWMSAQRKAATKCNQDVKGCQQYIKSPLLSMQQQEQWKAVKSSRIKLMSRHFVLSNQ